ncbi:MAG: HAMP domain-containing histidine kinase [Tissierellia bacterium]|nr:HAMP domain-containing histidine kinase [Tissierellia bacterium]
MDTKLKNIARNRGIKILAFILTVVLITGIWLQIQYISYSDTPTVESLFVKEYRYSEAFLYGDLQPAINNMEYIIEEDDEQVSKDLKYYYYVSYGDKSFSNAPDSDRAFFEQYGKNFYAFEKGEWEPKDNVNINRIYGGNLNEKGTMYLAFPDEYMKAKQKEWNENRDVLFTLTISIAICTLLALSFIIYLIYVTGRKPGDDELYQCKIDNIYSDILVLALGFIGILWLIFTYEIFYINGYIRDKTYPMTLLGIITAIAITLCGIIFLSMVRKIKAKRFIKHSLIYRFFHWIGSIIKEIFDGRRFKKYPLTKVLFYRQLIFIIGSGILVFFAFLLLWVPPFILVPIALEGVFIYLYIKQNNKTYGEINKGFNESLEEQMKSERMKIDLVTNVSHDLKTPLTSIISYIDLLSKEEDLSESAMDYVNILSEKSNRLKQIVSGLFDLAKSTSGDINLNLETLDLKKLIEQTLGDMKDEIEKSGLQIRLNLPDEGLYIRSDGEKLYRVFQNVIDNALKYSLKGTRVYIELEEVEGKAIATIKNIADYEMDFTAEDILQRFNRGDKSRTTDGSGLGLSIAESFTNVCGGDFEVDIDGDLFKVTIKFNIEE